MKLPGEVKGWVFAGIGVLLLVAAAVLFSAMSDRADSMTHAEGTVIRTYSGHPEIEFVTPTGQTVVFSESAASGYDVGEKVPVLYDPEDPERDPSLDKPRVYYFMPMTIGVIGAGWVVGGLLGVVFARRRRRLRQLA